MIWTEEVVIISIGSSPNCDIRVRGLVVAPHHATLRLQRDETLMIEAVQGHVGLPEEFVIVFSGDRRAIRPDTRIFVGTAELAIMDVLTAVARKCGALK